MFTTIQTPLKKVRELLPKSSWTKERIPKPKCMLGHLKGTADKRKVFSESETTK